MNQLIIEEFMGLIEGETYRAQLELDLNRQANPTFLCISIMKISSTHDCSPAPGIYFPALVSFYRSPVYAPHIPTHRSCSIQHFYFTLLADI